MILKNGIDKGVARKASNIGQSHCELNSRVLFVIKYEDDDVGYKI